MPYLLLSLHAKLEDQEATGSRQAHELKLYIFVTPPIIIICNSAYGLHFFWF